MPSVTRLGDKDTGHDACPPRALAAASPNVFANGKAVGRVGDIYNARSCKDHGPHTGVVAAGSGSVFINGIAAARIGDPVSCGGAVADGSNNVFIGG